MNDHKKRHTITNLPHNTKTIMLWDSGHYLEIRVNCDTKHCYKTNYTRSVFVDTILTSYTLYVCDNRAHVPQEKHILLCIDFNQLYM